MEMSEAWVQGIQQWALRTYSVREVWLFGSRAKGSSHPDSDIDLAIALMPPSGRHDWALGNYAACADEWQRELGSIVGRHVSLEAILPDTEEDKIVRDTGTKLWARNT